MTEMNHLETRIVCKHVLLSILDSMINNCIYQGHQKVCKGLIKVGSFLNGLLNSYMKKECAGLNYDVWKPRNNCFAVLWKEAHYINAVEASQILWGLHLMIIR